MGKGNVIINIKNMIEFIEFTTLLQYSKKPNEFLLQQECAYTVGQCPVVQIYVIACSDVA